MFESEKRQLQKNVAELENINKEKDCSISDHISTISKLKEAISSLKIDRADLNQKMLQIDRSIRKEVEQNYKIIFEKQEAEYKIQKKKEMDEFEAVLNQEHEQALIILAADVKAAHEMETQIFKSQFLENEKSFQRDLAANHETIKELEEKYLKLQDEMETLNLVFFNNSETCRND